jgi:hypothetical protein
MTNPPMQVPTLRQTRAVMMINTVLAPISTAPAIYSLNGFPIT